MGFAFQLVNRLNVGYSVLKIHTVSAPTAEFLHRLLLPNSMGPSHLFLKLVAEILFIYFFFSEGQKEHQLLFLSFWTSISQNCAPHALTGEKYCVLYMVYEWKDWLFISYRNKGLSAQKDLDQNIKAY